MADTDTPVGRPFCYNPLMIYVTYLVLAYITYILALTITKALDYKDLKPLDQEALNFELAVQSVVWLTLAWLIFFK